MYRFAAALDLSDIVGSEIWQISLGPGDVQFRFGSGTAICVQSRVTLVEAGRDLAAWDAPGRWTGLGFQRLLMAPVVGYSVASEKLLEIHFHGNLTLQLHGDSDQFESVQIYLKGSQDGTIVI